MKLSDNQKVQALVEVKEKLEKALRQCDAYLTKDGIKTNPLLPKGFDQGYWGHFSEMRDGSGEKIDLCGCYVTTPILKLIQNELIEKGFSVDHELKKLGVDVGEDQEDTF